MRLPIQGFLWPSQIAFLVGIPKSVLTLNFPSLAHGDVIPQPPYFKRPCDCLCPLGYQQDPTRAEAWNVPGGLGWPLVSYHKC